MNAVVQPQPTTQQIIAAFATALAPLAGPAGIAISGVAAAALQFYDGLKAQEALGTHYIMADALDAQGEVAAALGQLIADRAAQKVRLGE